MKTYFNASRAIALQRYLSKKVILSDRYGRISRIAAVDSSFIGSNKIIAVAGVFEYPSLNMIEYKYIVDDVKIPYIPGLLAFREAPFYIKLLSKMMFDIILVDGHGVAHPRFLGIAAHVGVVLNKPSIGVAKKKLYGDIRVLRNKMIIVDPKSNKIIGSILKSRGKNLYVSPGHRISVESATLFVKSLLRNYYLPVPLHMVDKMTKELKKKYRQVYCSDC